MLRVHTTLSLYVGRHFIMALLGTLAVLMSLILLLDFIELMRRAGDDGVGVATLLGIALLKLPNMVEEVLPFAVLIGGMISMWRLTRSQELVVMRAVGVSIWQFLAPPVAMVALIGIFEVMALNPLAAALYRSYEQMEDVLILRQPAALDLSKSGLWLRESRENGEQVVVHAANVRQEDMRLVMRGLSFIVTDAEERFIRRIDAKLGTLEDGQFLLNDAWIMTAGAPGDHRDTLSLPTELSLGRVQENFASPNTLSFWDLPDFIEFFEAAGFSAQSHRMRLHSLIALPFLLSAMVIMGAIFSVNPNTRSGSGMTRVMGGVAAGFLLYFFTRLTLALGLSATLPLWLAAWSPTLVTLLVGTAILLHQEDG